MNPKGNLSHGGDKSTPTAAPHEMARTLIRCTDVRLDGCFLSIFVCRFDVDVAEQLIEPLMHSKFNGKFTPFIEVFGDSGVWDCHEGGIGVVNCGGFPIKVDDLNTVIVNRAQKPCDAAVRDNHIGQVFPP